MWDVTMADIGLLIVLNIWIFLTSLLILRVRKLERKVSKINGSAIDQ